MCGVFGFVAKDNSGPDLKRLERIAAATQARGPHAFGFAWIDAAGRMKMFKQTGRIADHLGVLTLARDARMLIGHCRWATDGDPRENVNNHPHPADAGWFVRQFDMHLTSRCDSEVIGQLVERNQGSMLERVIDACDTTSAANLVVLGVWKSPDRLIALRRGNPLHVGENKQGWYLGSLPEALPSQFKLRDESALEFTVGRGGLAKMLAYDVALTDGAE